MGQIIPRTLRSNLWMVVLKTKALVATDTEDQKGTERRRSEGQMVAHLCDEGFLSSSI